MTTPEDRRAALNIKVSLASNLILVTLAFIGAEAGIAVFVLDKREHLFTFYFATIVAFLVLAASVGFGGWGIAKAYRDGYGGKWELSDHGRFNIQAILCLLGSALVVISSMPGTAKPEFPRFDVHLGSAEELTQLRDQVNRLSRDEETLKKSVDQLMSVRSHGNKELHKHNRSTSTPR